METRCAPVSLQNVTPSTSSTLSSLSESLHDLVHRHSPKRDDMTSLVWFSVRSCWFPLRLIHTPCRQSELQPDWRQTRRAETAHRSPALCSSWLWRAAHKTWSGFLPGRGLDPNANYDGTHSGRYSSLLSCVLRFHACVKVQTSSSVFFFFFYQISGVKRNPQSTVLLIRSRV